jgi:hypothetical protein
MWDYSALPYIGTTTPLFAKGRIGTDNGLVLGAEKCQFSAPNHPPFCRSPRLEAP